MSNFIANLKKIQIPLLSHMNVCIDMGTSNTRVAISGKGVVLREPTVIGYNKKQQEAIFFGTEAKRVTGKVPEFISIEQPVRESIIINFDMAVELTRHFLELAVGPYVGKHALLKPTLHMSAIVPTIASEIEQRAVEEVLFKVGARKVSMYERALATALGCGHNVFLHEPVCVVDMGGGTIEIAIISGGGVVHQKTLKTAGEHMNKMINNSLYLKHGIVLGESTVEQLKMSLFQFEGEEKVETVRGKSLETGLPKTIKVRSSEVREALLPSMNHVTDAIKELVEMSPPEVVDALYNTGITLTGGTSHVPGLAAHFKSELNLPATVAPNSDTTTINGLLRIARRSEYAQKLRMNTPY